MIVSAIHHLVIHKSSSAFGCHAKMQAKTKKENSIFSGGQLYIGTGKLVASTNAKPQSSPSVRRHWCRDSLRPLVSQHRDHTTLHLSDTGKPATGSEDERRTLQYDAPSDVVKANPSRRSCCTTRQRLTRSGVTVVVVNTSSPLREYPKPPNKLQILQTAI